jgi:ABC transporter substrate binding protein
LSARTEAFRQGLRELGYVEGKTIVIEWRSAEGQFDRLPSLAAELVRLNVDVIVTAGPLPTRPVKAATVTIPIVITNDNDPVANGFVASVARPGGNITGLSTLSPEIYGKQLELLKEIVPRLSRVAVLGDSAEPGHAQELRETEGAARALRVQLLRPHGWAPPQTLQIPMSTLAGTQQTAVAVRFFHGPRGGACGLSGQAHPPVGLCFALLGVPGPGLTRGIEVAYTGTAQDEGFSAMEWGTYPA